MGEPQESSKSWSALQSNVQIQVLAWLPWESLCRYRCVCKGWNDLFSSTRFITEHWALKLPNKKPRLVLMCSRRDPLRFMAYSFFTKTWKNISFSFLTEKYPYPFLTASFDSSAVGLILVTVMHIDQHAELLGHHIVCNPLTRTSLELPAMNDTTILSMGIRAGEGHHEATYEVVAVVQSWPDAQRIEVYDSSSKLWTTAGYLPHKLEVNTLESKTRLVFCGDVWYCLAKAVNSNAMGIIDFTIQNGIFTITTLPALIVRGRVDHLLSCGARILIATCASVVYNEIIIIWEFRKEEKTFHQIVTIDRLIFQNRYHGILSYEFEGINGDLICIKNRFSVEVFVYNLNENTLSRLPTCPIEDGIRGTPTQNIIGFQPRPDMKVE